MESKAKGTDPFVAQVWREAFQAGWLTGQVELLDKLVDRVEDRATLLVIDELLDKVRAELAAARPGRQNRGSHD